MYSYFYISSYVYVTVIFHFLSIVSIVKRNEQIFVNKEFELAIFRVLVYGQFQSDSNYNFTLTYIHGIRILQFVYKYILFNPIYLFVFQI